MKLINTKRIIYILLIFSAFIAVDAYAKTTCTYPSVYAQNYKRKDGGQSYTCLGDTTKNYSSGALYKENGNNNEIFPAITIDVDSSFITNGKTASHNSSDDGKPNWKIKYYYDSSAPEASRCKMKLSRTEEHPGAGAPSSNGNYTCGKRDKCDKASSENLFKIFFGSSTSTLTIGPTTGFNCSLSGTACKSASCDYVPITAAYGTYYNPPTPKVSVNIGNSTLTSGTTAATELAKGASKTIKIKINKGYYVSNIGCNNANFSISGEVGENVFGENTERTYTIKNNNLENNSGTYSCSITTSPRPFKANIKIKGAGTASTLSPTVYFAGTASVNLTPSEGYYIQKASCTNGYYISKLEFTKSKTGTQTATIHNNNQVDNTTCTITFASTIVYLKPFNIDKEIDDSNIFGAIKVKDSEIKKSNHSCHNTPADNPKCGKYTDIDSSYTPICLTDSLEPFAVGKTVGVKDAGSSVKLNLITATNTGGYNTVTEEESKTKHTKHDVCYCPDNTCKNTSGACKDTNKLSRDDPNVNQQTKLYNQCVIIKTEDNNNDYTYQTCGEYTQQILDDYKEYADKILECMGTTITTLSGKKCGVYVQRPKDNEASIHSASDVKTKIIIRIPTKYKNKDYKDNEIFDLTKFQYCSHQTDDSNTCINTSSYIDFSETANKTGDGYYEYTLELPANRKVYLKYRLEIPTPCGNNLIYKGYATDEAITEDLVWNDRYKDPFCDTVRKYEEKWADGKIHGKLAQAKLYSSDLAYQCFTKTLSEEENIEFNNEENFKEFKELMETIRALELGEEEEHNKELTPLTCEFEGYETDQGTVKNENGYLIARYTDFMKDINESKYWNAICTEELYLKYDYPKYVDHTGGWFDYQSMFTTVKTCKPVQLKKVQLKAKCKYGSVCSGNGHHETSGAGPNEEFDNCIKKCDNGKYTNKCINSCYKKVYTDNSNKVSLNDTYLNYDNKDKKLTQIAEYHDNILYSGYIVGGTTSGQCTPDQINKQKCRTAKGNLISSGCIIMGNTWKPDSSADCRESLWGGNCQSNDECDYMCNQGKGTFTGKTVGYNCNKVKFEEKDIISNVSEREVTTEHGAKVWYAPSCTTDEIECFEVQVTGGKCSTTPIHDYIEQLGKSYKEYNDIIQLMKKEESGEAFYMDVTEEYGCDSNNEHCSKATTYYDSIETTTKNILKVDGPVVTGPVTVCEDGTETCKCADTDLECKKNSKKYKLLGNRDKDKIQDKIDSIDDEDEEKTAVNTLLNKIVPGSTTTKYKDILDFRADVNNKVTTKKYTVNLGPAYLKKAGVYKSSTYNGVPTNYNLSLTSTSVIYGYKSAEPDTGRLGDYGPYYAYFLTMNTKMGTNNVDKWPQFNTTPVTDTLSSSSPYTKNIHVGISKLGFRNQWGTETEGILKTPVSTNVLSCFYGTTTCPPDRCEPLDIIFRPIDLTNVFPGDQTDLDPEGDGIGRAPRFNWTGKVISPTNVDSPSTGAALNQRNSYYENDIVSPLTLTSEIQRLGESIYNNDGENNEYHFTLTPIQMNAIRGYKPGDTNGDGKRNTYLDFTLNNCAGTTKFNGKPTCRSTFLDRVEYVEFVNNRRTSLIKCNNGNTDNTSANGCDYLTDSRLEGGS